MPATPAWPPRSLPRLYVETPLCLGALADLNATQANYLGNVLRLKSSDHVLLFDGTSGEWLATITQVGKKRMTLAVAEQTRPPEAIPDLWLAFAPVKRARIDWLVEKATELGVARLIPVTTQRTIVERMNFDRLNAHIVEAAEQCGRSMLPILSEPIKLGAFLISSGRTLYFADETGGEPVASAFASGPATILIGPEGGFTPEERDQIRAAPDARPISLGPRILRAETAAIAAIAAWMALSGDWR